MQVIPPYNGFGIPEDSLQNCLSLFPKPPRKDIIKMLENNLKVLRYQVALVGVFLGGIVPGGWEQQPAQTRLLANSPLCQWEERGPQANTSVPGGEAMGLLCACCDNWQLTKLEERNKNKARKHKPDLLQTHSHLWKNSLCHCCMTDGSG